MGKEPAAYLQGLGSGLATGAWIVLVDEVLVYHLMALSLLLFTIAYGLEKRGES